MRVIKPVMFGKYCLLERISVGGMAEVFRAKVMDTPGFDRFLALKRILPNLAEDNEFINMFIDEAKLAVLLNHQNICQIYELGQLDESYYIVMEYISGRDILSILNRMRRERKIMSVGQAAYLIRQMALGLDAAHRKQGPDGNPLNVIHRDISPQNILVSYTGEVKIIDFGIAKAASNASKTQVGVLKGKFGYMSPEQVRGLDLDRRSDIFALGTLFHELLTCRRLFHGASDFETLEMVRSADVKMPSAFNPNVPPEIDRIVGRALHPDRDQRYQWCSELADDLRAFLAQVRPPYTGRTLEDWMQRTFSESLEKEIEKRKTFAQFNTTKDVQDYNADLTRQAQEALEKAQSGSSGSENTPDEILDDPNIPPLPMEDIEGESTVIWNSNEGPPQGAPQAEELAEESTRILSGYDPNANVPAPTPTPVSDPAPPPVVRVAQPTSPPMVAQRPHVQPPPELIPTVDEPETNWALWVMVAGLVMISIAVIGVAAWFLLGDSKQPAGPARLEIKTQPVQDVEVFVDGKLAATKTPYVFTATQGPSAHNVEIRHPSYKTLERSVNVGGESPPSLEFTLVRKPAGEGILDLSVSPSESFVYVDGKLHNSSGGTRKIDLDDQKEHLVEVVHKDYFVETLFVRVKNEETVSKDVKLRSSRGKIAVSSTPPGVVFLNEKEVGEVPKDLGDLKPFTLYDVTIQHKDHHPWKRQVLLHRSLERTYRAKLRQNSQPAPAARTVDVGTLSIKTPKSWWALSVNGWAGAGFTSTDSPTVLVLPAGEHTVTFSRGKKKIDRKLTIQKDEKLNFLFQEEFSLSSK